MEFVGIERRRAAPDVFQIENPDDLVDINFFLGCLLATSQADRDSCAQLLANNRAECSNPRAHLRCVCSSSMRRGLG